MTKRNAPFLWATLVTPLLAGERHCLFSSWLPANYSDYEKQPSDFNSSKWMMDHTKMLEGLEAERKRAGETTYLEDENKFVYKTKKGYLFTIKPDLITSNPAGGTTIWDTKTGQAKSSHQIQVMLAMWLGPSCLETLKGKEPRGVVVYKDNRVQIPYSAIDESFKARVVDLIERLGSNSEPAKLPSIGECRWCSIAKGSCPERMDETETQSGQGGDL
jgi:hypothetical protein